MAFSVATFGFSQLFNEHPIPLESLGLIVTPNAGGRYGCVSESRR